jgi:hypothetical protein
MFRGRRRHELGASDSTRFQEAARGAVGIASIARVLVHALVPGHTDQDRLDRPALQQRQAAVHLRS